MATPLSAASAAALAQAALEPEMHMICDADTEHVRARTPVTGFRHFWELVAKTVKERHGISRGHNSIQKEYEGLKEWSDANRTDKHVNVRNWVKGALRRASRQQAAASRVGVSVVGERDGDEEEKEDEEEGEAPSAFTMQLPLPSFSPPVAQALPAAGQGPFSLPMHTKQQ